MGYYSSAIAVLCTAVSASLKTLLTLDVVAHPFNSSTWMQRQVELCKFKGILGYILNSGPSGLHCEIPSPSTLPVTLFLARPSAHLHLL